jgi:hypothetical protein
MRSQPGCPATAEPATGTKETTYALVSVLSHALCVWLCCVHARSTA